MSTHTYQQLRGYEAAFINIQKLLEQAEKDLPKKRASGRDRRLAAFRRGYYEGLAMASCFAALGEYPKSNTEAIRVAHTGLS